MKNIYLALQNNRISLNECITCLIETLSRIRTQDDEFKATVEGIVELLEEIQASCSRSLSFLDVSCSNDGDQQDPSSKLSKVSKYNVVNLSL